MANVMGSRCGDDRLSWVSAAELDRAKEPGTLAKQAEIQERKLCASAFIRKPRAENLFTIQRGSSPFRARDGITTGRRLRRRSRGVEHRTG
jgi:hypothetical protein